MGAGIPPYFGAEPFTALCVCAYVRMRLCGRQWCGLRCDVVVSSAQDVVGRVYGRW